MISAIAAHTTARRQPPKLYAGGPITTTGDVSDRRRYLDRLAHLVDHDVLTGLANTSYW